VSRYVRVRNQPIPFACLVVVTLFSLSSIAQPPKPESTKSASAFEVADVHVSPHRDNPYMRASMSHDRLACAMQPWSISSPSPTNVDSLSVLGGPAWLDLDHFDIIAKASRSTSDDGLRLMLRASWPSDFSLWHTQRPGRNPPLC